MSRTDLKDLKETVDLNKKEGESTVGGAAAPGGATKLTEGGVITVTPVGLPTGNVVAVTASTRAISREYDDDVDKD